MKIYKRLKNKLTFWRDVAKSSWANKFQKPPQVLSWEETIREIVTKRCSLSRNGDGEIDIMLGYDIPFQKYDCRLAAIMRKAIAASFPNYLSTVPDIFMGTERLNAKAVSYYKRYLHRKRYGYYQLAKAPLYGDSFVSRFYIDIIDKSEADKHVEALKSIWDKKAVILVEGQGSRLGVNNDLFANANSVRRIVGPSTDAFSVYDELMAAVRTYATKDNLILLALGPTATAMAYELALDGYWAVDIGHVDIEYEWYLMKAESKVPVPGKYTNEAIGDKMQGSLPEEAIRNYTSQIITNIQ